MKSENAYYFNIPGLLVTKGIRPEQIEEDINKYIDAVPLLSEALEDNFANISKVKHHKNFTSYMEAAMTMLKNVRAMYLEADANKILRSVMYDDKMMLAHKLLKPFIAGLLSLSIEMQKAQNLSREENIVSEAETHADMANNLSAAGDLIVDNEYEKAEIFITEMGESNSPDMFMDILNLLTDKKYEEAAALVNTLKEKHVESISQLAETDLSKKVLAVDDRPEILSFVTGALKNHYKVYGATGGEKALKFLETQKCDLFILDIDMPGMNGYELAETLRKSDDYAKTPIIFLTGNSARERILKAIDAGGNDFIVKPANYEILLAKASKFLNKS